jgi:hypothetical protein
MWRVSYYLREWFSLEVHWSLLIAEVLRTWLATLPLWATLLLLQCEGAG